MNKYDFGYEIQPDSTIEWAYNKVEEQSIVLELGPSNGNLAKHLLNEKNCIIDIIEIDDEAGEQAKAFARNSCIGSKEGNLEGFIWAEKLKNQKYDYIIILDVLEHLKDPAKVLKRLGEMLKESGKILVSIPNFAHNSVVIGLLNNQFRYTDVGLLDSTHLRFFTYESVIDMVYSNGYFVESEEIKQIKVGNNEINTAYEDVPRQIQAYLKTRHMGEAYQFLMVLKKGVKNKRYGLDAELYEQKQYNFNVFNEDGELIYSTDINPLVGIDVTIPVDSQNLVKTLRIDPLDKNCILNRVSITANYNGEYKEYVSFRNTGINLGSKIIFFDDDPQIYIEINDACNEVKFSCKVLDFDSANLLQVGELRDYVRKLLKEDSDIYEIMVADKRIIERLQLQNQDLSNRMDNDRQEIQRLKGLLDTRANEVAESNFRIRENEDQIASLSATLTEREDQIANLLVALTENKDELAMIKRHFLYRFWMKLLEKKRYFEKIFQKN